MSGETSKEEIGIFIKTSLGTRLALSVPSTTTAALLIREVERVHFECLPCFGEIKVLGFMVKHKSCFYRLSPSVPLTCVCEDSKGPYFIQARAVQVNTHCTTSEREVALQDGFDCKPCDADSVECSVISGLEGNLEQECQVIELDGLEGNRLEGEHSGDDYCMNMEISTSSIPASTNSPHEENIGATVKDDCASENSSATRSVTDIIRRHYSATDTFVESPYQPEKTVAPDITPRSSGFFMLKDTTFGQKSIEGKRPNVGQRLLMASSKLGISPSNPSPVVSMYRTKGRKHFGTDIHIKTPVFEISESSG